MDNLLKRTRVPYSRYREMMHLKLLRNKKKAEEEEIEEEQDDYEEEEDDYKLDDEESISTRMGNTVKKTRLFTPSETANQRQNIVDPHEACRISTIVLKEKLEQKTMESMEWKSKCLEHFNTIQSKNETIKNLRFLNEELQATVINGFDAIKDMIQNKKSSEKTKKVLNALESRNPKSDIEPKVGALSKDQKMFHMGRGVYISVEAYTRAKLKNRSNVHFVKLMALSLFDKQTLLKSTVTGKGSNRNGCSKKPESSLEGAKLLAIKDTYCHWLQTEKQIDIKEAEIESCRIFSYISKLISDMKNKVTKRIASQSKVSEMGDNDFEVDSNGTEESKVDNQDFSTHYADTEIKIEAADGPSEIKVENLENDDCIQADEDFQEFNDPLE